jgi:hypothetical protein
MCKGEEEASQHEPKRGEHGEQESIAEERGRMETMEQSSKGVM